MSLTYEVKFFFPQSWDSNYFHKIDLNLRFKMSYNQHITLYSFQIYSIMMWYMYLV